MESVIRVPYRCVYCCYHCDLIDSIEKCHCTCDKEIYTIYIMLLFSTRTILFQKKIMLAWRKDGVSVYALREMKSAHAQKVINEICVQQGRTFDKDPYFIESFHNEDVGIKVSRNDNVGKTKLRPTSQN